MKTHFLRSLAAVLMMVGCGDPSTTPSSDVPATDVPAADVPAADAPSADASDAAPADVAPLDASTVDATVRDVPSSDPPSPDVLPDVAPRDVPAVDAQPTDVSASDVPASDGGATLTCGSTAVLYPPYTQSCAGDLDCAVVLHQSDCCGNIQALGIDPAHRAAYEAAEMLCRPGYPRCGCPTRGIHADDDQYTFTQDLVGVRCVSARCTTFVRPM